MSSDGSPRTSNSTNPGTSHWLPSQHHELQHIKKRENIKKNEYLYQD
jgi:hypothetical protein